MARESYDLPGYYSPSRDWVGTRKPGDLTIDELFSAIKNLDVEAAYESFRVDEEARRGRSVELSD